MDEKVMKTGNEVSQPEPVLRARGGSPFNVEMNKMAAWGLPENNSNF